MANFIVAARLRRAIGALTRAPTDSAQPAASPYISHRFTDHDWLRERSFREAVDSLADIRHWHVTVTPIDRVPRHFHLKGSLQAVTARAHQFFDVPHLVLCEPALTRFHLEVIDRRLNLSVSTTTGEYP